MSEVYVLDSSGGVAGLSRDMFEKVKPGALFLYDDNGHHDFNNYDRLFDQPLCDLVISQINVELTLQHSEEKINLGDYLDVFGLSPKLGRQVSYRVIRKP